MKTKMYSFPSSSGLCEIKAWKWYPDDAIVKAVIYMHHGMAEHSGRYKNFIKAFTDKGYAVYMNDMINHGKSNQDPNELGYFGDNDGYKFILADAKAMLDIAKREYPNKKLIIAGHSMGSMVMRCFINEYGNCFDGAIFIGTSGANPVANVGIALTNTIAKFKGKKYRSNLVYNIGFSAYDKPFEKRTHYDWGTRDKKSVDDYVADELCGYKFTCAAYNDLAKLVNDCNSDKWFQNVHNQTPVLLTSGSMDPVGNYTKGVKEVYDKLVNTGHTKVTMKIYQDARHEILNELNKEEIYDDIDNWIEQNVLESK